jgi:hypothetical protein
MIPPTSRIVRAGTGQFVLLLAWLVLLVFIGAGSYLAVSHFVWQKRAAKAEPSPVPPPPATQPPPPPPTEPEKTMDDPDRQKKEEEARQEAERQEAERKKQEEAKRLAAEKEKERLEQQAREEQRKKEEAARKEAERLLALKRNPPVAALEDIETAPDKYVGRFVTVERVTIKLAAIERHKDLGRFTLGVTSERGQYYSRVPLTGLLVSTSDKLAMLMQKQIDGTDNFFRFKLFCEVRRWGKKDSTRTWPEVFVYRVEAFDRMGNQTRVMEE